MVVLQPVRIDSSGSFEVVGESQYQENLARMSTWASAPSALLVPEVGNPYDANAVRVLASNRNEALVVGYLSRELAEKWRPYLDGLTRSAQVAVGQLRITGGGEGRSFGARVDVIPNPLITTPLQLELGYQQTGQLVAATSPAPNQGPVIYIQQPKKQTNHILHLLLTVFTAGLWLPVWIIVAIANA